MKLLRQHQKEKAAECIEASSDWEEMGYVFASPTGGPLNLNTG